MKKSRFEQMQQQVASQFSSEQGQRISDAMGREYEALCQAYADQPKALFNHTHNNIFPVVSAFRVFLTEGMDREQAAKLANDSFLVLMDATADTIRRCLKAPGLYRLIPWVFKTMMPKLFGEEAGFRFRFYPTGRSQAKFDMLECPYFRICRELDCPELAPTFCATDDTCYGHMHPKLIWNRTQTLARGGEVCDFDLYIPKK